MQKTSVEWQATPKQIQALHYLNDKTTNELLYGGGAGGGKSYLGCAWLLMCCMKYRGSRWLMGRAVLKTLKETTLQTFWEVCKAWGLKRDEDFNFAPMEGLIKFPNGSSILLKDLFAYPSDPEFEELGSLEITGAFVDEASQVSRKAMQMVSSRIRFKLDEFGLIPKLLIASNPTKNFLYSDFYKPTKEKRLPPYRQFLQALVGDNPFVSEHYVENLKKLDKVSRERLLYGNWEYDDDPSKLFEYDTIIDAFTTRARPGEKYLSCDVARFGGDRITIAYWNGLQVEEFIDKKSLSTLETENLLQQMADKYQVRRSHIVIDEDGIGGGVVDHLNGVRGFLNNGRPISNSSDRRPNANYSNLKSQCYFRLADMMQTGQIGIRANAEQHDLIIEELEQIKRKDADKDGKLAVIGKDEIKEKLGRSPDFADCLMMRMYFELKGNIKPVVVSTTIEGRSGPIDKRDSQVFNFING